MNTEIKPCSCGHRDCYNLYVNGSPAVTHETMTVCDEVKFALDRKVGSYYSEAADVADTIKRFFDGGAQ